MNRFNDARDDGCKTGIGIVPRAGNGLRFRNHGRAGQPCRREAEKVPKGRVRERGRSAGNEVHEGTRLQEAGGNGGLLPQGIRLLARAAIGIQPSLDSPQEAGQFPRGDRLQRVLENLAPDGLLSVLELVVAGKDDDDDLWVMLRRMLRDGKAVHMRHIDIRHDDVGMKRLDGLDCLFAVFARFQELEPQAAPVDLAAEPAPDYFLIVNHQELVHREPCSKRRFPASLMITPVRSTCLSEKAAARACAGAALRRPGQLSTGRSLPPECRCCPWSR